MIFLIDTLTSYVNACRVFAVISLHRVFFSWFKVKAIACRSYASIISIFSWKNSNLKVVSIDSASQSMNSDVLVLRVTLRNLISF